MVVVVANHVFLYTVPTFTITILMCICFVYFQILQNLHKDFVAFVHQKKINELHLKNGYERVHKCKLLFDKQRPNSMKIGRGWKQFCQCSRFKEGDEFAFVFDIEEKEDYVDVTKV